MTTFIENLSCLQNGTLDDVTTRMEDHETDFQTACSLHALAVRAAGTDRARAYDREFLASTAEFLAAHLRNGARASDLEGISSYIMQCLPGLSLVDAEAGRAGNDLDADDDIAPMLIAYRT